VYTDPVTLNGAAVAVSELVAMARTMNSSQENAERTVVDATEGPDAAGRRKVAFAFGLRGRVDGRYVEMRVVDLVTITDGQISAVWRAAQPAW
jgi:ketosteroid isomerase-like protein